MRSETSSPSSTACGEPTGPSRQILAVVPEQLWLGRNLWHVSRRPPQAMIHGVLEKCFVLGPRGQFVGGSPMGLHTRQLPSLLTPCPPHQLLWITRPARETRQLVLWLRDGCVQAVAVGKAEAWGAGSARLGDPQGQELVWKGGRKPPAPVSSLLSSSLDCMRSPCKSGPFLGPQFPCWQIDGVEQNSL